MKQHNKLFLTSKNQLKIPMAMSAHTSRIIDLLDLCPDQFLLTFLVIFNAIQGTELPVLSQFYFTDQFIYRFNLLKMLIKVVFIKLLNCIFITTICQRRDP